MTITKTAKQILEEDLQTIGLEDDARSPYAFDFSFLKKQRRKEKIRLASLIITIFILFLVIAVLAVSYRNYVNKYEKLLSKIGHQKSDKPDKSFCPTSTQNEDIDEEKVNTCKCPGENLVKDEDSICRDIKFAIEFTEQSLQNSSSCHSGKIIDIPEAIDEMTMCLWYKNQEPEKQSTLLTYHVFNLQNNNIMKLSLENGTVHSTLLNEEAVLYKDESNSKEWIHLCYQWKDFGNSSIYINGSLYETIVYSDKFTREALPTTYGAFVLGGRDDSSFIGSITQLYFYSRTLSLKEIQQDYQNGPTLKEVVLGWWMFKGQCIDNGYSKEVKFPF